jgi:hypothetical protein
MIVLTLFLLSGLVITEPITRDDCRELMALAKFVDASGRQLSRDEGQIGALKCGDQSIVLMLPASAGDCELS